MSKTPKIITDFGEMPDPNFSDTVMFAVNGITANSGDFSGIPVSPDDILLQLKQFNNVRLTPIYPSRTADTEAERIKTQKLITKDGNWLNTFCDGNLSLLKKTGFPLQKTPESQGILPKTTLDLVFLKTTKQVEFFISHVKGAGIRYGIMYTLKSNTETDQAKWTFYYAASREGLIGDLIANETYKFVSFAMGTEQTLTYSDEVEIVIG